MQKLQQQQKSVAFEATRKKNKHIIITANRIQNKSGIQAERQGSSDVCVYRKKNRKNYAIK